jgi:hypothetical protein
MRQASHAHSELSMGTLDTGFYAVLSREPRKHQELTGFGRSGVGVYGGIATVFAGKQLLLIRSGNQYTQYLSCIQVCRRIPSLQKAVAHS